MKLYRISQTTNQDYDTFDSAVVSARNEDEARNMHPSGPGAGLWTWTDPAHVTVELIGTATRGTKAGVIVASYNAG
jgi:hypothetical protein